MYRTIVVPSDGSPLASRALPYGRALARAASGRLLLAYVPDVWDLAAPAPDPVEAAAAELRAAGVDARVLVCPARSGFPGRDLLAAAGAAGADLLVLATHGRGALGRLLLGSVADDVLRHAEIPVLVVPPRVAAAWPEDRPRRVLVPLDESALALAAVEPARIVAGAFGAAVTLFGVVELSDLLDGEETAAATIRVRLRRRRAALEAVEAGFAGPPVEVLTAVGDPNVLIARVARRRGAGLIAMATHGRGGVARALLGSTAAETLRRAGAPVLLVRPPTPTARDTG